MLARTAAFVLMTLVGTHPVVAPDRVPPAGVIVFIADDQGDRDAGVYGNTAIRTPSIDRLAAAGVRFDSAFLTTSSCSPSRSSLLTGRYPHSTGAEDLHAPLPADQITIARLLRANGVYTAAIGKWHLGDAERANWDTIVEAPGGEVAARTLEVFEVRPADRPFIVRWTSIVGPGRVAPGLVSAIDLAPTIADAFGLEMPTAQGRSLMPTLLEDAPPGREAVFAEANWHDYEQFTRAGRTDRFKLIRNYYRDTPLWHPADSVNSITWQAFLELDAAGRLTPAPRYLMQPERPFEELYDLDHDPDELTNVVDDPANRNALAALRTRLDDWRAETNDRMPAERRRDGFRWRALLRSALHPAIPAPPAFCIIFFPHATRSRHPSRTVPNRIEARPGLEHAMALKAGTKLGPYEILAALGSGGMGEVYKARDTRLDRTVAIKVLPSAIAADAEAKQRFTREAKTISSLNHPNICTLHDVGSENGTDYLVMEHLEGETLADRLKRSDGTKVPPLQIEEALTHAIAIADALDTAHRHGITHRDLKPGNVMLTASGAKLLDFGLAKLTGKTSPFASADGDSAPPTATSPLTDQGMVLGTLQYMSPEQLQGKEADARSDIFAFGALVHEMVTGQKAFAGEGQASVIAAILEREPVPVSDLRPLTPSGLDRVLKKCLAKDPDRRWQSAGDLADALRWLAEPATGETAVVEGGRRFMPQSLVGRLTWAAGILVVGVLAGIVGTRVIAPGAGDSANSPLTHATLPLQPEQQLYGALVNAPPLAISPDGTQIAYTVSEGTTLQLYLQRLDEFGARRVPQSEGANNPIFSPDGQWVGFLARNGLYKVLTTGGAPVRIADGPAVGSGAHWTADDAIFYSDLNNLYRVPADGGVPEVIFPRGDLVAIFAPYALPDGNRVLVNVGRSDSTLALASLSLETRELSYVPGLEGAAVTKYLPTGVLIYNRGSDLWAGAFDPASASFVGSPAAVLNDVEFLTNTGVALASVSDHGTLLYARADRRAGWSGSIAKVESIHWRYHRGDIVFPVSTRRTSGSSWPQQPCRTSPSFGSSISSAAEKHGCPPVTIRPGHRMARR